MPERRFRRVPFSAAVEVSSDKQSWSTKLVDIAMRGALVAREKPLPLSLGSRCRLSITLPGSLIALDFTAELIHHKQDHYGFKFLTENLETLTHLRKLIELNTGDTETTRSELDSWLKSSPAK